MVSSHQHLKIEPLRVGRGRPNCSGRITIYDCAISKLYFTFITRPRFVWTSLKTLTNYDLRVVPPRNLISFSLPYHHVLSEQAASVWDQLPLPPRVPLWAVYTNTDHIRRHRLTEALFCVEYGGGAKFFINDRDHIEFQWSRLTTDECVWAKTGESRKSGFTRRRTHIIYKIFAIV